MPIQHVHRLRHVYRGRSVHCVRSVHSLAWLATLAALGGCTSTSQHIGQFAVPAAEYRAAADSDAQVLDHGELVYQLQAGDQIDAKFYYHPELNEQLVIGPDNRIALQLIGEVDTGGLSTRQLAELLTARYSPMLRNPQATVQLRKYALPRIYVAGEVAQPGAQPIDGVRLTALQAIVQGGGFRHGAERGNVVVLRNSGAGKPLFIKLDLQGHLEQTLQSDILLRPYDIVYVPQKRIAEVADFFDQYINKIVPIYRNLGFNFNYNLRNEVQVQTSSP